MSNIDSSNGSMQSAGIPNVRRPNGGRPKRRIPNAVSHLKTPAKEAPMSIFRLFEIKLFLFLEQTNKNIFIIFFWFNPM